MADGTRTAQREIRLALVLNGGVSLAIWIGGVVAEVDRARRAGLGTTEREDEVVAVYRRLLALTGSLLRTDVIAGASAGGLNGCLLASAIVSGGAIDDVRDTWIELGSFTRMLRSGLRSEPQSLLKGDEYFLPKVEAELLRRLDVDAARRDVQPERCAAAAARRVELFVTGTNLTGQPVQHLDDSAARSSTTSTGRSSGSGTSRRFMPRRSPTPRPRAGSRASRARRRPSPARSRRRSVASTRAARRERRRSPASHRSGGTRG